MGGEVQHVGWQNRANLTRKSLLPQSAFSRRGECGTWRQDDHGLSL